MDKLVFWGGSGDPVLMLLSILALVSSQISLYELIGMRRGPVAFNTHNPCVFVTNLHCSLNSLYTDVQN